MKKRLFSILGLVFLVQTLFMGAVNAEYLPQYDKTIVIQAPGQLPQKFPLNEDTAQLMFDKQEAFIDALEAQTGRELDHYYIWVYWGSTPILAIDPPAWGT